MFSEHARHRLHDGLKVAIGDDNADTLMQALAPFSWQEIARKEDLVSLQIALEARFDGKIAELRGEMYRGFAALESKVASVESSVASLTTKLWLMTAANIVAMFSVAGVVTAAGS